MDDAPADAADRVTTGGLDHLIEAAAQDRRRESAFFRALLQATLYAHAPLHDRFEDVEERSEHRRLVMFKSPDDGSLVVPVFTDRAKAEFAARGHVRVVEAVGRVMLEGTRGATLMINPNDVRCTLYPEEISALLAGRQLAPVEMDHLRDGDAQPFKLPNMPGFFVKALRKALASIPGIDAAYVVGMKWRDEGRSDSILIVLRGLREREARDVRAMGTGIHAALERWDEPVDVMLIDRADPVPGWIAQLRLRPVYRRRQSPSPRSSYN